MSTLAAFLTDAIGTSPLNSGGSVDDHMQAVYFWVFWVSVVIGVVVSALIIYSFFRFRRRSDDEEPEQFHGNTKLEIGWTAVPAIILIILFVITQTNMAYVVDQNSGTNFQVSVIGQQFSWTYYYEGQQGPHGHQLVSSNVSGGPKGNQAIASVMFVPSNTAAKLWLSSTDGAPVCPTSAALQDPSVQHPDKTWAQAAADRGCGVNHSFYIPALAGQMNAIPGRVNTMWLDARAGVYYGQCTELCGNGHNTMLLRVVSIPLSQWNCLQKGAAEQKIGSAVYDQIDTADVTKCKVDPGPPDNSPYS